MQLKRLRCTDVKDGLFSREKVITVQERGNGTVVFIVPVEAMQDAWVKVEVFEHSGEVFAVIPAEYPKAVAVDRENLQPA